MSVEKNLGDYFKSEAKSGGAKLYRAEKIALSGASDTSIQGYVKVAPPCRVQLSTSGIESETCTASCNCPMGRKGRFCKHVWATLLCVEEKNPDFLSSKRVIEQPDESEVKIHAPKAAAEKEFKESAKARANAYRKEQYQKQKTLAKERKRGKENSEAAQSTIPAEIEPSMAYFNANGFSMPMGPSEAVVSDAKRKLSRIFHPDKGGSNEEMAELNYHCEVLLQYIAR